MLVVFDNINTFIHKILIQLYKVVVFSLKIDHRASFSLFIDEIKCWYMRIFCHFRIICTKGRCDMYDTCSIVSGNIIAKYHSESFTFHFNKVIFVVFCHKYFVWVSLRIVGDEWCSIAVHLFRGFYPRHKLLVMKSFKFLSFVVIDNLVGYYFVSLTKSRQVDILRHFTLCGKICTHSFVRHDDVYWLG